MDYYCSQCGHRFTEMAQYCSKCGAKANNGTSNYGASNNGQCGYSYSYHYEAPRPVVHEFYRGERLPWYCWLAYIPGLFWLPLAFGDKSRNARISANERLILTVLSFIFGMITVWFSILIYKQGWLDYTTLTTLFTGWTSTTWMIKLPQVFLCQILLGTILFVPINSICGFFRGMSSAEPYVIPLWGQIRLIRIPKAETTEQENQNK